MNPLANMFQRNQQSQNNPVSMMQQFNQFRSNFTGDPKQTVMNLLASGRMSQEQFGQLSSMARMFQNGFK